MTSVENFASEIIKGLKEYSEEVTEIVKDVSKESAALARKEIAKKAPVRTGKYKKSFAVKKINETRSGIGLVVHSRNRYYLAHLLEKGHVIAGKGARVKAFPHIKPAEEKAIKYMESEIERRLK